MLVGYGNPKEEIGGKQKKTSTDNFVDGLKPANEEWLGYKAVRCHTYLLERYVSKTVLPLFLFNCRRWCACHKFDSIYRKYVQPLYLQINLLKN